jgi:hypothetical protein
MMSVFSSRACTRIAAGVHVLLADGRQRLHFAVQPPTQFAITPSTDW